MLTIHDDFKPLWTESRSRRKLRQLLREQAGKRFAVETNQYVPFGAATADTTRRPSGTIWGRYTPDDVLTGRSGVGVEFWEDFSSLTPIVPAPSTSTTGMIVGDRAWATFVTSGGTINSTDPNLEGGVALLGDGGSNSIFATMQQLAGWARFISPASTFPLQQKIFFEARIAVGSITGAKRDIFVGLMSNATPAPVTAVPISATNNALTTTASFFGFWLPATNASSGADVQLAYNNATNASVITVTNLTTLVNTVTGSPLAVESATNGLGANFVKLGFLYDPTPDLPQQRVVTAASIAAGTATVTAQTVGNLAKPMIQFFVNGQVVPTFLDSNFVQNAAFPSVFMAPCISYRSGTGSSGGSGLYCDWLRMASYATI